MVISDAELEIRIRILKEINILKRDLDDLGIPWDGMRDLKRSVIEPVVNEQVTKTLIEMEVD